MSGIGRDAVQFAVQRSLGWLAMIDDERIKQERQKLLEWISGIEFPEEDEDDSAGPTLEQMLAGLLLQVAALRLRVEALEAERKG
jgi:hypothetical protein